MYFHGAKSPSALTRTKALLNTHTHGLFSLRGAFYIHVLNPHVPGLKM